jgi:hypothetical protein
VVECPVRKRNDRIHYKPWQNNGNKGEMDRDAAISGTPAAVGNGRVLQG